MICPECNRPVYFLESYLAGSKARCLQCRHRGDPVEISYETYHDDLYSKPVRRDRKTDPQMKWILSQLAIQPGDVVVDLGCGVGDYTREIHSMTSHAAGYDRDVRAAIRKCPGVSFFAHNLNQPLPLPNASVDKIVSINVIEHLFDWHFFLQECVRVLRPGGLVAFSTANKSFLLHEIHFDPTHYHEWTLDEFKNLAGKSLKILQARKDCAMFNYYPLNQLLRFFLKPDLTLIARKPY